MRTSRMIRGSATSRACLPAAAALLAVWLAAPAPAGADTRPASGQVKEKAQPEPSWTPRFVFSSRFSRLLLHADDGRERLTVQTDNSESASRLQLRATSLLAKDWTAGATVDAKLFPTSSSKVRVDGNNGAGKVFGRGSFNVYVNSKTFGRLSFGHGGSATDGIADPGLSGTTVITDVGTTGIGSSLRFVHADAAEREEAGIRVGQALESPNGQGSRDRVRYGTPSFKGFRLSTSVIGKKWFTDEPGPETGSWDLALRYNRRLKDFRVQGKAGWWTRKGSSFEGRGGSAAVLTPSGTSFGMGYSTIPLVGVEFWGVRLGQRFKFLDAGRTLLSVGYDRARGRDRRGTSYDVALVQRINNLTRGMTDLDIDLFGIYKVYTGELQREGTSTPLEDIAVIAVGLRINFSVRLN